MTDPTSAERLLAALARRDWTVAAAESLTGGLVVSALVDVPGASAQVRGGVVAYAVDVKRDVLDVDRALLADRGAVDPEVALQMAEGVRRRLAADVGIATTGVAGPDAQEGKAVGTLCIAVVTPESSASTTTLLHGDRAGIRRGAVSAALELALTLL